MDRNKNLEQVRSRVEPWDVIVIGGGATGVGCALDAATRGLDVLLVEQSDFGWGTSSRSTKLVHGGVRYLRQGNISLVREALKERGLLLKNAPHIAHTQEFVVPCYSLFQKLFYGVGLKIYDMLAGKLSLGGSRLLSRSETIDHLPTVKRQGLVGGVLYYDGQFDDTRLLIDMAVTAAGRGVCLINYSRVAGLIVSDGQVAGVRIDDAISGEVIEARSRSVINATGAFCDPIRQMSDASAKPVVTFARGTHIVLDRRFLPTGTAVMIPKTSDGRVLFCIPWLGHVLVGTTDVPCETTELGQMATVEEVDFLLETVGAYLTDQPTHSDILSQFAGVRPLVGRSQTANTASLSRSHELFVDDHGLITITGGKWTTYRRMAQEAVDRAIKVADLDAGPCITEDMPILAPTDAASDREHLHPDLPYGRADILRAIRNEMAQTVDDVLARRTRCLFLNVKAAREIASMVAEIIASELGRNESQMKEDLIRFDILARQNQPGT